jgi:hypothetical protein
MNQGFVNSFNNSSNRDPISKFLVHLLGIFKAEYSWLIMVEGLDDLNLFKDVYENKFPKQNLFIIPAYGKFNIPLIIDKFEFGSIDSELIDKVNSIKRMIIVDSDYDKLLGTQLLSKELSKKYNLQYLNVYSVENYFFFEENIKIIFEKLDLPKSDCDYFIKNLNSFHKFIKDFEICSYVKTASFRKISGLELHDLPELGQIDYYNLVLDKDTFVFEESLNNKIRKSYGQVVTLYPKTELDFIEKHLDNIGNIRGKSFRTIFYDYIANKKMKKLPDFQKLLLLGKYLRIELPRLED